MARSLAQAKRPDPTCKTGVVSLAGAVADRPQACCPAYCGECSDYPECDKVRGQDSANACCLSKVLDLECREGRQGRCCFLGRSRGCRQDLRTEPAWREES